MMSDEVKAEFVRNTEATVPTGKFGQVEDVVEAYLWVMKDGNATGTVAGSDSGFLVV
jgi:NAD(P)-dependent dehydrogenase (short-subunit alcohol dehydrogenase family)